MVRRSIILQMDTDDIDMSGCYTCFLDYCPDDCCDPLRYDDMKYATMDELEITRFFDELQAHIVVAGGAKLSHNQLKDKPLEQIVRLIWPNGIKLKVTNETNRREPDRDSETPNRSSKPRISDYPPTTK